MAGPVTTCDTKFSCEKILQLTLTAWISFHSKQNICANTGYFIISSNFHLFYLNHIDHNMQTSMLSLQLAIYISRLKRI